MASKSQIKRIHMLKSRLGIDESTYREMLSGYGVSSSKDLNFKQAAIFLNKLEDNAVALNLWEKMQLKYEDCNRENMATPSQLRFIMGLWREDNYNHDQETQKKLRELLSDKIKLEDIKFLSKKQATNVIYMIQKIKKYYQEKKCGHTNVNTN